MNKALLFAAAVVLLICIYYGSRKGDDRSSAIIAYVVAMLCAFAAVGTLSVTTTSPAGIFLACAAAVALTVGTLRVCKLPKQPHQDKEAKSEQPVAEHVLETKFPRVRKGFPWNAWGLVYLGVSIGATIGLAHSGIKPGPELSTSLWTLWGLLLLLGAIGIAVISVGKEKPAANRTEKLARVLKVPLVLASYLIPGALIGQNPFTRQSCSFGFLSRSETIRLLVAWSLWGLLCAVLAGLYTHQAAGFVLFGAIFLVPAMVGWARFRGFAS